MDVFQRERELCDLFIRHWKTDSVSINYFLSNKSVDIIVRYNSEENWNVNFDRNDLDRLWRNFNLAFIDYDTKCYVIKNFYAHCIRFVSNTFFQ